MATIDTARTLRNALNNGSSAINGRSVADMTAYGRAGAALHLAIMNFEQLNPGPFGTVPIQQFKPNGSFPGAPGTLVGDYVAVLSAAVANTNATCTAAGASGPVGFATTAAGLPTMLTALQARVTAALALQTASGSMTAALNASLVALNLAYGPGLPAQNDTTALAALQATATTALNTAVADATAVCTAFGISLTGGGN